MHPRHCSKVLCGLPTEWCLDGLPCLWGSCLCLTQHTFLCPLWMHFPLSHHPLESRNVSLYSESSVSTIGSLAIEKFSFDFPSPWVLRELWLARGCISLVSSWPLNCPCCYVPAARAKCPLTAWRRWPSLLASCPVASWLPQHSHLWRPREKHTHHYWHHQHFQEFMINGEEPIVLNPHWMWDLGKSLLEVIKASWLSERP